MTDLQAIQASGLATMFDRFALADALGEMGRDAEADVVRSGVALRTAGGAYWGDQAWRDEIEDKLRDAGCDMALRRWVDGEDGGAVSVCAMEMRRWRRGGYLGRAHRAEAALSEIWRYQAAQTFPAL